MHTIIKKFIFLLLVLMSTISPRFGNSDTNSPNVDTDSELNTDFNSAETQANDSSVATDSVTELARGEVESFFKTPVICLSPGHPSMIGDKHLEAIINRKVTWLLAVLLLEANYNVVLAVADVPPSELFFSGLSNDDEGLWSQLAVLTPEEKAKRCSDAGADYLISIHHNFAFSGDVNQTMVLYTDDENYRPVHKEAQAWADLTADYLGDAMETDDSFAIADRKRIGFPLGILSNAQMPGILTEASFYSNPEELARLNDDTYLSHEAQAIFNAFAAQFPLQSK